jgi:hypothetical protein
LQAFLENWAAHGTSLVSLISKYNRFIILAVDQDVQSATGCSIDASVEFPILRTKIQSGSVR